MLVDPASVGIAAFPPSEPPAGYNYLLESRLAQELSKPFLNYSFEGVPLAYALLVSIEQLILEGQLTRPDLNPPTVRLKQSLKAALYPGVWCRRSVAMPNLDSIPKSGLLIRIEVADMFKEWDLISGTLPKLEGFPVWLLCGETRVPDHCRATGLPALPNDLRLGGTTARFMREYYSSVPRWSADIRALLKRHRLPDAAFPRILGCLAMTLMNGVQMQALLSLTQPRMLAVDCDHSPISAWLVFFARRMGIPTVTLQHGDIPDTPLWADYALLWGEQSARSFRAFGARSERLRLVGYPRLTEKCRTVDEIRGFKRIHGLPMESKIVVLATERGILADRLRLAKTAWAGILGTRNHVLVIKCHPAEFDKEIYSSIFKNDPRGRVFSHDELGLDLALSMADVVLAEWSGVAKDALIKGRPVIVLNLRGDLLANQQILDHGACRSARDSQELVDLLVKEEYSFARHPEMKRNAVEFLKDSCVAYGDEASERIAGALRSIWSAAQPRTVRV